ncbi:MAG: hypothetical protein IKK01_04580 [Clostridia bacterium]|nr:hypothetical protein [Clostridia bacterium]
MIFVTHAEKLPEFPPDYTEWTYEEIPIDVPYFSIADLCKCFPNKKGDDLLAPMHLQAEYRNLFI